jgi:hypothetical protein
MKHTPGPWTCLPAFDDGCYLIQQAQKEQKIWVDEGYIESNNEGYRQSEVVFHRSVANARLIAAAPELLEALTHILSEYDAPNSLNDAAFRKARAAIAKATGVSE